jgi:hypothetical protein
MTAEEFVIDLLINGQRLVPGAAVRLLKELKGVHAHELAERQRDMRPTAPPGFELRPEYVDAWRDGTKSAAEMIDPEMQS